MAIWSARTTCRCTRSSKLVPNSSPTTSLSLLNCANDFLRLGETVKALDETEKEMILKSQSIAQLNNDLKEIEIEREEAKEKHQVALQKQYEMEALLNSYSVRKRL
jgi:hypothetical protein